MMYIRDLAAMTGLTLVVAGHLPLATRCTGQTLPGAEGQTGQVRDPVGREPGGHMWTEGAPVPTGSLHEGRCDPTP
jgi:hypothetical protein